MAEGGRSPKARTTDVSTTAAFVAISGISKPYSATRSSGFMWFPGYKNNKKTSEEKFKNRNK